MKIESIVRRKQPGRKMQGIAAALLPFEANGRVAVEAFQNHLGATHRAGLMNAVNMDTGYVNFLSEEEKRDVLRWAREALGAGVPFVAGAYIECQDGEVVALYRKQIDAIVAHDWDRIAACFELGGRFPLGPFYVVRNSVPHFKQNSSVIDCTGEIPICLNFVARFVIIALGIFVVFLF